MMLICPVCRKELRWNADHDNGEQAWGDYSCDPCRVEVAIMISDYSEDEQNEE